MPQTYVIDVAATWPGTPLMFMLSTPKTGVGVEKDVQTTNRDGVPQWTCQIAARSMRFGKPDTEILSVTVAADKDPGEEIMPGTPVGFTRLEVGTSTAEVRQDDKRGARAVGGNNWHRAERIFALNSVPTPASRKAE
jgi:hypothetical protein